MINKRGDPENETVFAGEVPLIPNVRPVIILSGSDYDMGYQCYQQMVQIFGPWILDGVSHDKFTEEELSKLKAFQWNIKQCMPEFIDYFKGLAAGATDAGVPLSYQEVLAAFATIQSYPEAPAECEDEELPPATCSGWATWGSATKDGKLICGGQAESAMHFGVTIIAFPDKGNSYIHSPSSMPGLRKYSVVWLQLRVLFLPDWFSPAAHQKNASKQEFHHWHMVFSYQFSLSMSV